MGKFGAVWMVNMTDRLMEAGPATDFALNGHGWQILNRVFQEVVSHLKCANRPLLLIGNSKVCPEVSFAATVKKPLAKVVGESSATVAVGKGVSSVCGYQLKAQKAFSKFLHTSVVMGPGLDASNGLTCGSPPMLGCANKDKGGLSFIGGGVLHGDGSVPEEGVGGANLSALNQETAETNFPALEMSSPCRDGLVVVAEVSPASDSAPETVETIFPALEMLSPCRDGLVAAAEVSPVSVSAPTTAETNFPAMQLSSPCRDGLVVVAKVSPASDSTLGRDNQECPDAVGAMLGDSRKPPMLSTSIFAQYFPCREIVEGLGNHFIVLVTNFYSRKNSCSEVQVGQEFDATRGVGGSVVRAGCLPTNLLVYSVDSATEDNIELGGIGQVLVDCDVLVGQEVTCNTVCDVLCADGQLLDQFGSGKSIWEPLQIRYSDFGRGEPSNWVLHMVSSFSHMVGVSCEGYQSELLDLFVALERDRGSVGTITPHRSGGKMMRELKGLKSSINYDGGDVSSRRNRKCGRANLGC
ncbi:hypothetical protein CJ030_MR4G023090 [Morella rubra]|uniref:Uncharacterized protein n=1 Tax=Morella rubra TaxID=262757 RepID=A0A6A1VX98_9ROSI|nr:hypothetical protein CJ030_MR4G023090 [Morella rubra]